LAAIREQERAKVLREEAVNNLEGYLYRLRDLLDDTVTSPSTFKEFVQDSELVKLQDGLVEGMKWMHSEIDKADTATIWKKRNDIE
jgi:hypoxia up-regulated 1